MPINMFPFPYKSFFIYFYIANWKIVLFYIFYLQILTINLGKKKIYLANHIYLHNKCCWSHKLFKITKFDWVNLYLKIGIEINFKIFILTDQKIQLPRQAIKLLKYWIFYELKFLFSANNFLVKFLE